MTAQEQAVRRVLVIGGDAPALGTVIPLLKRTNFEVVTVGDEPEVEPLVAGNAFDLLIVGYPMRAVPFERFLATVRAKDGPCRKAGLLVIAPENARDQAEGYLGRGVNRVVREDWGANRLILAVADLAGEAPRVALRTVVQLELRLGGERELALCQVENLSVSGMLVRSDQTFPVGTRFDFDLTLPGSSTGVRGTAEIVRQADPRRERLRGFAARFVSFRAEGRDALEAFVAGCPR